MTERCDGRVTRADGSWLPCSLEKGHGISPAGYGCTVMYGEPDPVWNPRDTERRKGERRAVRVTLTYEVTK